MQRFSEFLCRYIQQWLLPLTIVLLSSLIQAFGWANALRYQRTSVIAATTSATSKTAEHFSLLSPWWRWISGHFAHLGWEHLLLNCAALLIVWELFFRDSRWYVDLSLLLFSCVTISGGLYFLSPNVEWYVGLSGVLHALFVYGALTLFSSHKKMALVLLIGVAAKLIWEHIGGALTGALFANENVVIDAHLYGAGSGLAFYLARRMTLLVPQWREQKINV